MNYLGFDIVGPIGTGGIVEIFENGKRIHCFPFGCSRERAEDFINILLLKRREEDAQENLRNFRR